jgi:predicted AAA+ superfamily ATPase
MIEIYRDIKYLVEQRLNALKKLSPQANLVQVLLGPRQVGKTTAVRQIEKAWEGPVIFATADLPAAPAQDWIRMQWQAAGSFGDPRTLLVLDEVQKIANWSSMIKALVDEERLRPFGLRVVLLGSASWTHAEGVGAHLRVGLRSFEHIIGITRSASRLLAGICSPP